MVKLSPGILANEEKATTTTTTTTTVDSRSGQGDHRYEGPKLLRAQDYHKSPRVDQNNTAVLRASSANRQ